MTLSLVNLGTAPNDHTGDPPRTAGTKINAGLAATDANTAGVAANTASIATNTGNIATNTSAIAATNTVVSGHTTSINLMLPRSIRGISLSQWPGIDPTGVTNNQSQFLAAQAAALSAGVPLIVDCKCWVSVTTDNTKCVFFRTGTYIEGTPAGQLIVDNSLIPGFILHHATDVTIRDLNIRYIGAPPWDITVSPYPALIPAFNDVTMKNDMATTFGNTFTGSGSSFFVGNTNTQSVFRLMGQCARVKFINVTIDVPPGANAANFAGCAFSLDPQWTPGTLVTNNAQVSTASNSVIPTDIDIINCRLDGYLMGIVGSGGVRIHGLKGLRYSDIQKSDGTGAGGNALYFAPPHLVYLVDPDPSFSNWGREICNVYDYGLYVGGVTRRASTSGSCLSLKIAPCKDTVVDGYTSLRPDGFADILTNQYGNQIGNMKNLYFVYDSSTAVAAGGPIWGVRFPSPAPYNYLTVEGLVGRDLNPSPTQFPVLDMVSILNQNCDFKGVKMYLNDWAGTTNYPGFGMSGNNMTLDADYYFNQYSSDQTLRGSFCMQGTELFTNGDANIRVHGFRLFPVVFSVPPTLNTALAANWGHNTGNYLLQFADNEARYVTLTNGSTVTAWCNGSATLAGQPTTGASGTGAIATILYSGGGTVAVVGTQVTVSGVTPAGYNGTFTVTAAAPGSVSYANATTGAQTVAGVLANFVAATAQDVLGANYNGYKQRMLSMQSGKGIGNRIRIMDVTNGHESICQNGAVLETWSRTWNGTIPAGATFDLPWSVPATHNPDMATAFVQLGLGITLGLTGFNVGWAATAAALLTNVSPTLNTNAQTAYAGTILTNAGTNRVLRLTSIGGNFDGTGIVQISVRCQSVSGAT